MPASTRARIGLYRELGAAGQLPIRIYAMLADSPEGAPVMQPGPRLREFDDRLQMRAVKALADGALGSRGAAMLQDYSDQPRHRGLMLYTREQMQELATLDGRERLAAERPCDRRCGQSPRARHVRDAADDGSNVTRCARGSSTHRSIALDDIRGSRGSK